MYIENIKSGAHRSKLMRVIMAILPKQNSRVSRNLCKL